MKWFQLIDLTNFGEARKVKKAVFQEAFLCTLVSNREVGSLLLKQVLKFTTFLQL